MTEGHEALAMFTNVDAAAAYRAALSSADGWTVYQPPREKLIEVLAASRDAGILYAALDPLCGTAKTIFDIPRVLASAAMLSSEL